MLKTNDSFPQARPIGQDPIPPLPIRQDPVAGQGLSPFEALTEATLAVRTPWLSYVRDAKPETTLSMASCWSTAFYDKAKTEQNKILVSARLGPRRKKATVQVGTGCRGQAQPCRRGSPFPDQPCASDVWLGAHLLLGPSAGLPGLHPASPPTPRHQQDTAEILANNHILNHILHGCFICVIVVYTTFRAGTPPRSDRSGRSHRARDLMDTH